MASQPESRESVKMCSVGRNLYIFGGFAKEPFNDTRVLTDCETYWVASIEKNIGEEGINYP